MNSKKAKQLRKTIVKKTPESLLLIRNESGGVTQNMGTASLWRKFKKLYKNGKVDQEFLVNRRKKEKRSVQ